MKWSVIDLSVKLIETNTNNDIYKYAFNNGKLKVAGRIVRVPNVKFKDIIGKGANAVVLLGVNSITLRQVAVKVWLPREEFTYPDRRRFLAEVRKLSQLNKSSIVQIYSAGIDRQGNYFAEMEYVKGKTIEEWLYDEQPLYLRCMVLVKILSGIESAHDIGLYHGDLHTKNVMIDNDDEIKILDFGTSIFAKTIEDSHMREGKLLFETGVKIVYEEQVKYNILDIDYKKYPPECVRESLKALTEIIRRLESIDNDLDSYSQKEIVLSIYANIIDTPFFNLKSIEEQLNKLGFNNDVIGLLYRNIFDECNVKLYYQGDDYVFCSAVSEEFKEKTKDIFIAWREKYSQRFIHL